MVLLVLPTFMLPTDLIFVTPPDARAHGPPTTRPVSIVCGESTKAPSGWWNEASIEPIVDRMLVSGVNAAPVLGARRPPPKN